MKTNATKQQGENARLYAGLGQHRSRVTCGQRDARGQQLLLASGMWQRSPGAEDQSREAHHDGRRGRHSARMHREEEQGSKGRGRRIAALERNLPEGR